MGLVSIDNWQFDKVGDYRNTSFEEGGVLVRCSVHDAEHGKWLVQQGREGLMEKERAGKLLCEEDKEGGFLLFFSDGDTQIEAGLWNREATENIAHKLSAHFHQWLIKEASGGPKRLLEALCARETLTTSSYWQHWISPPSRKLPFGTQKP